MSFLERGCGESEPSEPLGGPPRLLQRDQAHSLPVTQPLRLPPVRLPPDALAQSRSQKVQRTSEILKKRNQKIKISVSIDGPPENGIFLVKLQGEKERKKRARSARKRRAAPPQAARSRGAKLNAIFGSAVLPLTSKSGIKHSRGAALGPWPLSLYGCQPIGCIMV